MSAPLHSGELSQELAKSLLDGLPAALAVFRLDDPDDPLSLRYLYANGTTHELSGTDPSKVIGKRFADLGLTEAVQQRARLYAEVARTGKPVTLPEFYREGDALSRAGWYSVRLIPLPDRCVGFLALNATERKQAESQVAEQERFLEAILENLPHMVFVKDAKELRFLRFNKAGEELLGYPRESLIGKNDFDFFPKVQAEFFTRADREVLAAGLLHDISEEPIDTAMGRRWLHTKKVPVPDEDGNPKYLLGISEDITEAREQQAELVRLMAVAEKASAAKSLFMARVSHEIRTPLNAILGMTELVLESALSPEQREHLEAAQSAAAALRGLVDDILDYEKGAAGRIELRPQAFAPREHLDDVLRAFRATAMAKAVPLVAIVDPQVPQQLSADPMRLRQVLVNLVGNAVKFTRVGQVIVRVAAETEPDGRTTLLRYEVADTGPGIRVDRHTMVFEAFRQVEDSPQAVGGTGLGLAIARQLVELMGGHIGLSSEVGLGATFWFTVPCRPVDQATVAEQAAPAPKLPADLRVLVVEDNAVNVLLMTRTLERSGCMVTVANNGIEALRLIEAGHFDIALMDVQMPELDGLEATRRLRLRERDRGLPHLPVIALTAHNMPGDRERCLASGADGYLSKPIERHGLAVAMAEVLQGRSAV